MFQEINQQMEEAQQGIYRLQRINSKLKELQDQKNSLENKVSELDVILKKENLDVTKLENKSLTNLFYSMLGKIDEKIDQEKKEALAAKLKHEQAVSDLESVEYEIGKLRMERKNYLSCARDYDTLYLRKKEMLMQSDPVTAEKILEMTQAINRAENNIKEIKEAIEVGNRVLNCIDDTLSSLKSAEGWGTWDMLGGGLMADLAKHSHIDEAKQKAEKVQSLLLNFRTELADVKINNTIHFEMDGFAKFADFFFDGLLADWSMQSKINASQESVRKVKSQVGNVMTKLGQMNTAEVANVNQLKVRLDELVLNKGQ